jgi:hypothetical protein
VEVPSFHDCCPTALPPSIFYCECFLHKFIVDLVVIIVADVVITAVIITDVAITAVVIADVVITLIVVVTAIIITFTVAVFIAFAIVVAAVTFAFTFAVAFAATAAAVVVIAVVTATVAFQVVVVIHDHKSLYWRGNVRALWIFRQLHCQPNTPSAACSNTQQPCGAS